MSGADHRQPGEQPVNAELHFGQAQPQLTMLMQEEAGTQHAEQGAGYELNLLRVADRGQQGDQMGTVHPVSAAAIASRWRPRLGDRMQVALHLEPLDRRA